jgi:ATP-binding cassette subfamily F protein 2
LQGQVLLEDADLKLNFGRRYGLVGPNGCGKTLLLALLGRRMLPLPANLDVYHLTGEIEASDMTALDAVKSVDREKEALEEAAARLEEDLTGEDTPEQDLINERLSEIYDRLDELGADDAEARAALILFGLGFDHETMHKACKDFSGGWRMRIALARALFVNPTFLILDGPTAHLDVEAVLWLENYLKGFSKILLFVSHSQDFMNEVCTDTIRVFKKKLEQYGGNYDSYMQARLEKEENQMKRYVKQQDEIANIKGFIARFAQGTRASQAQSREKQLERMAEEGLEEKVEKEQVIRMRFPAPGPIPPPVLQLSNVSFGYPGREQLYDNVDFGLDLDSRVALVGPNGRGKTTLLKLITSELNPTTGAVRKHPHLRIGRYTQHYVDTLDLSRTPLEHFMSLLKDDPIEEVRKRLGRFGVTGDHQTTRMSYLSDGIKSRVVFAQMALKSPHFLLLDEPTNSLDIEMIDSLADAINNFEGGVVLVSHDMRLLQQVAKEIYECDHKKVTKFRGDIMDYKKELAGRLQAQQKEFEKIYKSK